MEGVVLRVQIHRAGAQASPLSASGGLAATGATVSLAENIQFIWGGYRYCWYYDGWRGPGWYRCGFSWRRGFGWGGPLGWRGWAAPGPYPGSAGRGFVMADPNIMGAAVLRAAAQGPVPATVDRGPDGEVLLRQPLAVRGPGRADQGLSAKEEARAPDSAGAADPVVPAADPVVAAGGPGPGGGGPATTSGGGGGDAGRR